MCLGVKDFPSFIYPDLKATTNPSIGQLHFNFYILQKPYFQEKAKQIVETYLDLEKMHIKIRDYVISMMEGISESKRSSNRNCNNLYSTYKNFTFLQSQRICTGKQCNQIAVKYFGEPAAPQNVRFIKSRATGVGMALGGWDYYLSDRVGFGGNKTTYEQLYGTRFLPEIEIYEKP